MASVSEQLLAALDELVTDKLKRFKWHLRHHYSISAAALEKVDDAPDTVDLMMERFRPEEAVKITVDILRKLNQNHLAEELEKKHKQETFTNIVPRTRNDFLRYSRQLSLDLNTVNKRLCLSERNRVITNTDTLQPYPDHPDRFDSLCQVLCRESVCGRCYWELEWSGYGLEISVSYNSISRKGLSDECIFGHNDQSWSLRCSSGRYSFMHNNIWTALHVEAIISRRIGVFVDHGAGTLSFYSVSDTMSLIHTVQTTFTQPLYPGISAGWASSVKLC